eukprot:2215274-Pleurochrysis_carterae.AAC.3
MENGPRGAELMRAGGLTDSKTCDRKEERDEGGGMNKDESEGCRAVTVGTAACRDAHLHELVRKGGLCVLAVRLAGEGEGRVEAGALARGDIKRVPLLVAHAQLDVELRQVADGAVAESDLSLARYVRAHISVDDSLDSAEGLDRRDDHRVGQVELEQLRRDDLNAQLLGRAEKAHGVGAPPLDHGLPEAIIRVEVRRSDLRAHPKRGRTQIAAVERRLGLANHVLE